MSSIDRQSQQEARRDSQGASWARNGQAKRLDTLDRQARRMPPLVGPDGKVITNHGITTAPVTLGKTKSIGDVLAELAARGQAPISVGYCRTEGCEARGWIKDGESWLCANHMHSHATSAPPKPTPHPIAPIVPIKPEPKPSTPMLMLPAPAIVALLPAGKIADSQPPAVDVTPAASTAAIEFPAHRVTKRVNPDWIAAFSAAHNAKPGSEAMKALIEGNTPPIYVTESQPVPISAEPVEKPAEKPVTQPAIKPAANWEADPLIAPIVIESIDIMPGLIPAAPYVASDVELAYEQRVQTVRRMAVKMPTLKQYEIRPATEPRPDDFEDTGLLRAA